MAEKKPLNPPLSLALHLTEACNLRCKMCYEWGETGAFSTGRDGAKPKFIDFDALKGVIDELAPRRPYYSLFGGEPLMYPKLEELIVAMKEAGSFIDTPTNGTLLEKNAEMLVRTGFDVARVSIDGPREINDAQRGKGSYDRAMAGIEALHRAKQKSKSRSPSIQIIYTVTPENHLAIERFFLEDLYLPAIDMVSIQTQNFLTREMGEAYGKMIESEFGETGGRYWKGLTRPTDDFRDMDFAELSRQANLVRRRLAEQKKNTLFLPPTFSEQNLAAYFSADWGEMTDKYSKCPVPWAGADITAAGDVAPCHVFYDLTMGNVHEQSFTDIWNGERYNKFRDHIANSGLMSICHGCCILYLFGQR